MLLLSVPFYDFPSSPILIIGAIGIVVALAVFFLAYKKYFNSPFNKELQLKRKALLKEKTELNKKLEKIEQDLKNNCTLLRICINIAYKIPKFEHLHHFSLH